MYMGDIYVSRTKLKPFYEEYPRLRYKSYRFSFWGWSEVRVIAYEHDSGKVVCNRQGDMLKKLFAI